MPHLCSVRLLTVEELAKVLGLAPATIKNRLSQQPETLPPRRILPNSSAVRFSSADVDDWINNLEMLQGTGYKRDIDGKVTSSLVDPEKKPNGKSGIPTNKAQLMKPKKRGRPTISETIKREKLMSKMFGMSDH